jgi:hypothetical protein
LLFNGGSGGGSGFPFRSSSYGLGIQPTSVSGGYGNRGGDLRDKVVLVLIEELVVEGGSEQEV